MKTETAITHAAPGRVRVRVKGASRRQQAEVLDAVRGLEEKPGVTSVQTDSRTGSALVQFNAEEMTPEELFTIIRGAHEALADVLPPRAMGAIDRSTSEVAAAVVGTMATANRRVLTATHGSVDLRMLAPIGLAGLSARQFVRTGPALKSIPWYVLAYYAFDSFLKLHQDGAPRSTV